VVTRLTRETPRLTWLLAVAAVGAQPALGQTLQRPDPIPVARIAESPAPIAGSRLVIRSGLRTPALRLNSRLQENAPPNLKSEDRALWLSLGSTLLPMGAGALMLAASDDGSSLATVGALLMGSGLYFGPAVGYWYGDAAGRGWKGVGIRFGTGLLTSLGVLAICGGDGGDNCNIFDSSDDASVAAASILMLAGLGVMAFSAVYDIAKVKSHVRKANDEKRRHVPQLSLFPVVSPANGGTAGLAGRVRF
jgi:hypothetical protein